MATLDIVSRSWSKFKITSPTWLDIDDKRVHAIKVVSLAMNTVLPVERITLNAQGALPYVFEVRLVDGRRWTQNIYQRTADPELLTTMNDLWRRTETANIQPIREAILALLVDDLVTDIDIRPRHA